MRFKLPTACVTPPFGPSTLTYVRANTCVRVGPTIAMHISLNKPGDVQFDSTPSTLHGLNPFIHPCILCSSLDYKTSNGSLQFRPSFIVKGVTAPLNLYKKDCRTDLKAFNSYCHCVTYLFEWGSKKIMC